VALAILAAGCTSANTASVTTTTYIGVRGGSISFGMAQIPTGCNPHTTTGNAPATRLILNAVLPSPFVINDNGNPTPNPNVIVQSELISTKPETIVYTLNPHAVWSDGAPITAKDFMYAWQQQRADPTSDPTTVASIAGYRDIKSVVGSDKGRTVTVKFHTVFADWQMLFSNLLPAHIMKTVGWNPTCISVNPAIDLSGGPFRISEVSAQAITLSVNSKWWGPPPNVRRIVIHLASSSEQLASWMRTGYVQVALPSTITPSFLSQVTSLPNAQSQVSLSSTVLQLEMANGITTHLSPDMRFAISLSVDRQALVTKQVNWALGSVQVATSHLYAQGQSGYHGTSLPNPNAITSNAPTTSTSTSTTLIGVGGSVNFPAVPSPTQAAALMTASGYVRTDGSPWHTAFGVPLTLHIAVDEGDPWAAAIAPLIKAQLNAAGFAVSLYPVGSAATAGAVLSNGFADMALLPRTTSPFLSQSLAWYTTSLGPPGQNGSQDWTNFDNPMFNTLITTASQQLNPNTATKDYQAADTQLWGDLVGLPLFTEPSTLVWSRKVANITPTPTSDSLLWYAQYWAVRMPENTSSTTPNLPGP
jgi:peptide/nickel transport system substrate-binding protein